MKFLKNIVNLLKKVAKGIKGAIIASFKIEGGCTNKGFSISGEVRAEVKISSLDSAEKDLQNCKQPH